jgi:hypothetical protein
VGTIFIGRPKTVIPKSAIPKTLDPRRARDPGTKICGECRPNCKNDRFTVFPQGGPQPFRHTIRWSSPSYGNIVTAFAKPHGGGLFSYMFW